ncbi:MAG: DNA alkylation repair protein [Rikenellaceae bacterium]|nr:DNA alkylation repair protein [Rikenellaceae bacterium]
METTEETVIERLGEFADADKAKILSRFFKTGPGEYGEGDIFIGVTVPAVRKVATEYHDKLSAESIKALAASPVHEHRLAALLMMVCIYQKSRRNEARRQTAVELYLASLDHINNWDLVDLTAPKILAPWLENRDREVLYELSESGHLWRERIAIVTCLTFIRKGDFDDIFRIAERHLGHRHDLIHKAIGWMLREVGKKDEEAMTRFLEEHYRRMPRTALRYAIERMEPSRRKRWLKGDFC